MDGRRAPPSSARSDTGGRQTTAKDVPTRVGQCGLRLLLQGYSRTEVETERFEKRALAHPNHIAILRTAVVRHAERLEANPDVCDAVRLAVSEALTNVVMHAYLGTDAGPITVQARLNEDDEFVVRVLDDGHGLIPRGDSPGLGLGFRLMVYMAAAFRNCEPRWHIGNRGDIAVLACAIRVCVWSGWLTADRDEASLGSS